MSLILNLLFFILTQLSLSLSILLPHVDATFSVVLNVTAALYQSQQVLSFKPSYQPQEYPSPSSSSSFKLQLHPKNSLFNSHQQHKDYRSLALARLSHDSTRLNQILSKLNLWAPVRSDFPKGAPTYVARIGVGQPAKSFDLVPDMGSDFSWLQCKPCSNCYNQSDPIFDPSMSSSYSLITCEDKRCKELDNRSSCSKKHRNCQFSMEYEDGTFTKGALITETMTFGNTGSTINHVAMGCAHNSHGDINDEILGLGPGPLSFPSQINASSFSYCFVDRDSINRSSTLEFNSPRPVDSLTAPLLRNPDIEAYYYVGITGISVGGQKVSVPPYIFNITQPYGYGGFVLDSGTTITYLLAEAYDKVHNVFVEKTKHLPRAKPVSRVLDTCYDLSSEKTVTVPTVAFEMSDGRWWSLPASGILYQVDHKGTFCFAFAPSFIVTFSIIGMVQQQGTRVSIDLKNSVVGFSPHKC